MDWGKFRDALDYGHHQLGISEELDNPQMRSEAYLNLARAHERLGEFMWFTFNRLRKGSRWAAGQSGDLSLWFVAKTLSFLISVLWWEFLVSLENCDYGCGPS